jgi:hypothetical protein
MGDILSAMRALLVTSLLAALAACSKPDNGPGCPAVVDHMLEVMKAGLTGHDSVALGDREQMIQQCEQRKMTPAERRCLAAAKTLSDLATCRPKPPAPVKLAPAGSGSAR